MKKVPIRAWRVIETEHGIFIFCDPKVEHLRLYEGAWKRPPRVGNPTPLEKEVRDTLQRGLFEDDVCPRCGGPNDHADECVQQGY